MNVFKPYEHTVDYHIRKPNDEKLLFEIGDNKWIYKGEKVFTFQRNCIKVKYSLDLGFNNIQFPDAYGEENIYFLLHQKSIPIQKLENSTEKVEYQF